MKFDTVISFGTLREDITLPYDFSEGLEANEIKLEKCKKNIGGSVYNTSLFLSKEINKFEVSYITRKFSNLSKMSNKMRTISSNIEYKQSPLSLIGVKEDGDKKIISYDPEYRDDDFWEKIGQNIGDNILLYTSLYELSYDEESKWNTVIKNGKKDYCFSFFLDLCPLINRDNTELYKKILKYTDTISGNICEYKFLLDCLELKNIEELFYAYPNLISIWEKRGENGAAVYYRERDVIRCYSRDVKKICAINTTGCGDVFNGAVIAGLYNKWNYRQILDIAIDTSAKVAENGLPWL